MYGLRSSDLVCLFVCLSLMFPETWFGLKIWDARIVICSQNQRTGLGNIDIGAYIIYLLLQIRIVIWFMVDNLSNVPC